METPPQITPCPTCSSPTYAGTNYCYHCATPLNTQAWQENGSNSLQKNAKAMEMWLIAIIAWGVFVGLIWRLVDLMNGYEFYQYGGFLFSIVSFALPIIGSAYIKKRGWRITLVIGTSLVLLLWIVQEISQFF